MLVRFGGKHRVVALATAEERDLRVFGEIEIEGVDGDEEVRAACVRVAAMALAAVSPTLKVDGIEVLWHATIVPMLSRELAGRGGRAVRVVDLRAV